MEHPDVSVFFDPSPLWVRWMRQFCGDRSVVECGCGVGHVALVLRQAGLSVCALDIEPPDFSFITDIVPINSAKFEHFGPKAVALMCRPCRGDWIHATIFKAVEAGSELVYVGRPSHFAADLEPLPYNVSMVMTDAGVMRECVWVISKEQKLLDR